MNTNQFLAMMEQRQAAAKVAAEESKGAAASSGDQEMADQSAASSMIDTTGGAARGGGTLIGSNNPQLVEGADITEEDERRGALAFLADQEKKSKFRDRKAAQLEQLKKTAHHTRAKIRVKMPDGYILQGTFGAKEKVKDVYEFVKNSILLKDREFILFETPPKRVLTA